MSEKDIKKANLKFAAINPYYVTNIVNGCEKVMKDDGYVIWGDNNRYPQYIYSLFNDVTEIRTIVKGFANFVTGEEITTAYLPWKEQVNKKGDTLEDIVLNCGLDLGLYEGFAINVIRNKIGGIAEIYYIDFKKLRSDKDNEFFFYTDDWDKSYGRVKTTKYPKFRADSTEYSSIYYYKNSHNTVYPQSPIAGDTAVAAETARSIARFHLNSIKNGFSSNVIINFNAGVPDDELKEEIEKNLNEKFGGEENAGRMMVSFNDTKDNEVTVSSISAEDFGDRYNALSKSVKQEIFTAFRAHPVLFGLPTDGTGFNDQDFQEAFKLYNKTVVLPAQKTIKKAFEIILGSKDVVQIVPFEIDWTEDADKEIVK